MLLVCGMQRRVEERKPFRQHRRDQRLSVCEVSVGCTGADPSAPRQGTQRQLLDPVLSNGGECRFDKRLPEAAVVVPVFHVVALSRGRPPGACGSPSRKTRSKGCIPRQDRQQSPPVSTAYIGVRSEGLGKQAVVIGTGAGGLTAAVALAQDGYDVTALERERQLGGFLNPFKRRKYHFDPGVHYVGQCSPGGQIHRVLDRCGIDAEALFAPMDQDGYDVLRFPDFEFRVPQGIDAYRDRLAAAFPSDTRAIDRLAADMHALNTVLHRRSRGRKVRALPRLAPLALTTFGKYLSRLTRNPKLRSVIAAQGGDYGLPPSRTPALLGLGLNVHFLDRGSFFPRGGSGSLRDALVAAGQSLGVVYHRRAPVAAIEHARGRVTGVRTEAGQRFAADVVVSAIDPTLTYGRLLDESAISARMQRKVARNITSVGSLCLYYGMKRDLRQHGLGAANVWDYPTWDVENAFAYAVGDSARDVPDDHAFFLSPNSLKDDTGAMAPSGCSTLEVVTLTSFAPYAQWADQRSFKRSAGYHELKAQAADALRASVDRRWPGLIGDVEVEEVSTPVTNNHFAGVVDGGIYGPAAVPEQFGPNAYRARGTLTGLYLAGAGVIGPGVAPSLASGLMAAKAVRNDRSRGFANRARSASRATLRQLKLA